MTVLALEDEAYREIGVFGKAEAIASVEFANLNLIVDQVFAAEN